MDGEWEHQPIRESAQGRGPVEARMPFVESPCLNLSLTIT